MKQHPLTTSYDGYKSYSKRTFELYDSVGGDNVFRVFPHRILCDTAVDDRCVTNSDDGQHLYYYDDDHPSTEGSKLIVRLILDVLAKNKVIDS